MEGVETMDSLPEIADTAPEAMCESANLVETFDDQNTCSEEIDEVEACSERNEQVSLISPLIEVSCVMHSFSV